MPLFAWFHDICLRETSTNSHSWVEYAWTIYNYQELDMNANHVFLERPANQTSFSSTTDKCSHKTSKQQKKYEESQQQPLLL